MDLLGCNSIFSTVGSFCPHPHYPTSLRRRFFAVRSSLPFPSHRATYHRELKAAVDVVERACRLCVDVQKSLFSSEGRIIEKNDQTPVTIADFGVQALVSLELSKLFPSIPMVAEEDSAFLRSNNLVDSVVNVVTDKANGDEPLTNADILEAIDRGGKDAFVFCTKPATYWVLDPIDGTRGFVKGSQALYVVGLALVVEGEIVLGVMGCPNWQESGTIMVAHSGCVTWTTRLSSRLATSGKTSDSWTRCYVDKCSTVNEARFCIPESQTWGSLPLSSFFSESTDAETVAEKEILLLPTCCGSLCKYLMVASGRASVFILRAKTQTIIKAWDHAVGMICVHEAGGQVSDWNGSQLDLGADQVERRALFPSGGVLVTNSNVHNQILEMISSGSSAV